MRVVGIGLFMIICIFKIMCGQGVISEFHYDNVGAGEGEFVEVFWPNPKSQPADLSDYRIFLYNGANSMVYGSRGLQGISPSCDDEGCYYVWGTQSLEIQDGAPDGIALAYIGDPDTMLLDFISYEGTFVALGGPADGVESLDIGIAEDNSTPVGHSLQRRDNGTWFSGPETRGIVNPIELSFFDAVYRKQEQEVEVVWETLSENNNAFFEVEKSQDGYEFEAIGRVWGAGESQQKISYKFDDRNPNQFWPYYRLKQVGFDDGFMYSRVVEVDIESGKDLEEMYVYCHDENIWFQPNNTLLPQLGISIYNLEGQLLFQHKQLSGNKKIIDSHSFPEIVVYIIYSGREVIKSGKLANF